MLSKKENMIYMRYVDAKMGQRPHMWHFWVLSPYFYAILVTSQKKCQRKDFLILQNSKRTFLKGPEPVLDGVVAAPCII